MKINLSKVFQDLKNLRLEDFKYKNKFNISLTPQKMIQNNNINNNQDLSSNNLVVNNINNNNN